MPWFRRPADFDAAAEQRQVAEAVLRSATALVDGDDEPQRLITRHCETLTALAPHIVLAWVWFGPPAPDRIRPQIVAGRASAYARALDIRRDWLTRHGPAFRSLAGQRLEPFGVSPRSLYGPWRRAAIEHGVQSVLALPLRSAVDEQRGLFVLYADLPGYFDRVGVGLFDALGGLFSAMLSRAARNAELAREARRDALTGLANRRASVLDPSARRLVPHDPPSSVVVLDVDHFKTINDRFGHAAGDEAIRRVARLLQSALRADDLLLRWGGEEFVVWLPGEDARRAGVVAEKLRAVVAADAGGPALTVSAGVAALEVGEPLADAIARADAAMYAAKQAGRNRVHCAEPA